MSPWAAELRELAARDLRGVRLLLPAEPVLAAFHLQQAAEKLVKAVLIEAGVGDPPRTHDIARLLTLLPGDHPRRGELAALADLTDHAVLPRYGLGGALAPDPDPAELGRRADEVARALATP